MSSRRRSKLSPSKRDPRSGLRRTKALGNRTRSLAQFTCRFSIGRVVEEATGTERRDHGNQIALVVENWCRERKNPGQHFTGGMSQPGRSEALKPLPQVVQGRHRPFSLFHLREFFLDKWRDGAL